MRLLPLISFCSLLCSNIQAHYLIQPDANILTISIANYENAPQYDIELREINKTERNSEVLIITTSPTKKKIDSKLAFDNFKKIGGKEEYVDILLTPLYLNIKYDDKSLIAKADITFSNGDFPTESYIHLESTDKIVEVSIG